MSDEIGVAKVYSSYFVFALPTHALSIREPFLINLFLACKIFLKTDNNNN